MLTDSHSHIQFGNDFPDVEEVIERAELNGVTRQILVSCTPKDSFSLPAFLNRYVGKKFYGSIGVDPHDADMLTKDVIKDFGDLIERDGRIVALGEIGLDFFRNLKPKEVQVKAFMDQLDLARNLDMPVILHVREAYEDALRMLKELGIKKAVLHSFAGDISVARECWERGYYTSFSGVVTYPKNEYLRDIAAEAPEDLFLIESDCPYLPPQKYRGQRNEPAYVFETAKEIAMVRRADFESIAEMATRNTKRAFNLPE